LGGPGRKRLSLGGARLRLNRGFEGGRVVWAFQVDLNQNGEACWQVCRSGFPTKAAAFDGLRDRRLRAESGAPEPTKLTVGQWLDQWHLSRRADLRGSTWAAYGLMVRAYVVPTIGALPLRSLTRAQLRSLYADLADHGGRGKRPLSAKSVHNVSLMLSRAFGDAVEDRIIDSNPGARAHKLPSGRRDMKTWTGDQVHAFLGSVARDRLAGLWRLAFSSGMRRGELLGLRWSDLDLDGATLSVQQTRIRGAEGLVYGSPKTAKGRRRIALDAATVVALRAHRRAQAAERLLAGSIWHDEDLVFCRADGQPLDPDSVSQSFERLSARAGLPRIRLHDARHTAASLLLAAGVHPKVVQERLGHATIATTLDTYSQVLPGLGEDAAERLAAAIDGAR
jgi:integrase